MRGALHHRARLQPDTLAFSVGGAATTCGALARDAAHLASALREAGLAPGDHLAILLPSSLDFVRAFYAAQWLGVVPVPLNPELSSEQVARRLVAADCRALIGEPSSGDDRVSVAIAAGEAEREGPGAARSILRLTMEALKAEARVLAALPFAPGDPEAIAYLQFTSGTSGAARAAVILHRQLEATLRGMHEHLRFGPGDVMAGAIPLHHNFGLVRFVCAPVYSGCPCHLTGAPAANVGRWLELMTEVGATTTAAPDYLYRAAALRVHPGGVNLRALRFASNGGEGVQIDTIRRFEDRFGVPGTVRPGYGLTETTLTVSTLAPGLPMRALPGGIPSCGPALPGTEIRIVDEQGAPLPAGEAGEITVRGPSVFAGYYRDPEGTGRVLRGGWLWTGDQGVMDADGHLYVTGRQRWMIKRAGATIIPGEAEEAAGRVQGVGRAAALGVPDPRGSTERFILILEVDETMAGAGHDALLRLAGEVASAVARGVGHQPGEIVIVGAGALPRTGSGKLRHGELRDIVSRGEVNARLHPVATFS